MSNQIVITSGAKLRDLDDVIIGTDGILSSVAFNVANGVPRLDENGKILVSQLPNSVMEFKGVWNAATNTPYLTNGVGNAGDVWLCNEAGTVDFGDGPIYFAVGDYAVYTGTEWARSSGATGTVTSVGVSRDGNALAITGSPVTTSGTINLGFSGDNTQYINGAGNLTTFPNLITSIGLTMPAAFNVSNSPLTANGTIGVTAAGYPSQYIRGDGTLADFPTSGGGGSSVSYYLNGGTSQGTIGGTTYYEMSKTADTGTGVDFNKTGDGLITAFLTDAGDPALLQIPAGNWNYEIYASMSANGGTPQMYAELYVYNGTTFTLISTSSNEILYDGTNLNLYTFAMTVPQTALTVTDRLAIKLYATNSGGKTTTVHTQDSHLCQVITTFTTGITALNGLTAQVQYFGTGTSGTDFNIVSSVDTHTFNIPSASATNRGLITTGTQTIAGAKTFSGATTFTSSLTTTSNLTFSNSGYTLVLQPPTLSVNRTVTLPNGTGTLALTSDLSSYLPLSGGTLTGATFFDSGIRYKDNVVPNSIYGGYVSTWFNINGTKNSLGLSSSATSPYYYTYDFPNVSGTIALTSDLTGGTVTSVAMTVPTGLSISGSPITTSGTLAVTLASGYSIPTNASQTNWDTAYTNRIISLTTTGTSGAATLISNVLNIPNYGSALSGYVPYTGATTNLDMGANGLYANNLTIRKISTSATIDFPNTGTMNDPAYIKHTESPDNTAVMSFSVGDNDATNDYFVFGNTSSGFVERFKITANGIVTIGTWQGSAIADSYISSAATWNAKQNAITLTTTGTSGAATFVSNTLNIPNYGSALSSYLPLTGGTLTGPLGGTSATFSVNQNSTITNSFINTNTTNNSSRTILNVTAGNATLQIQAIHNDNIYITPSTATDTYLGYNSILRLLANGNATFSGNVAIGSSSAPSYTLDVSGTGRFTSTLTVGTTAYINTDIFIGDTTSGDGRLFITSPSNQGITLRRAGSADRFKMFVGNGTTYTQDNAIILGTNTDIDFYTGASPVKRLTIANGGTATFSSSVTSSLNGFNALGAYGFTSYEGAAASGKSINFSLAYFNSIDVIYQSSGNTNDFGIWTNGGTSSQPKFYIKNGGNVGIGTNSPVAKLSVAGCVQVGNNTDNTASLSYGGRISAKMTDVSGGGGATVIHRGLGSVGYFILVSSLGGPSNSYRFTDLIYGTGTGSAPSVLASSTVGSPPTRTYSMSGENVAVSLSGSGTYIVTTTGLGANES